MGGDAEGAVTALVIAALLPTTQVNTKQQDKPMKQTLQEKDSIKPHKSSKEISIETINRSKIDKKLQISDDRYTSSYQIAHCSVLPSSPPPKLTEFPPQRSSFSYHEGNFESAVSGRPISYETKQPAKSSHFKGGLNWCDRGSVYRSKSSHHMSAFAHSLRKYPRCTPTRTVSSDLVNMILKRAQAQERESAKTQSLRSKSRDVSPNSITRKSKNIQTYTRTPKTKDVDKIDARVVMDSRRLLSRRKSPVDLSTTYDYLKASAPRRQPPVRLNKTNKELWNTLRQIYKNQPKVYQMCSSLQKRYNQHKKICPNASHGSNVREPDEVIEDKEDLAPTTSIRRLLLSLRGCDTPCKPIPNPDKPSYCICSDTCKCGCNYKSIKKCQCCLNRLNKLPKCDGCKTKYVTESSEEYYKRKIDEDINKWLSEIPVQNNEDSRAKKLREDKAKKLAKYIKQLPDDDNFEEETRNAIEKCVSDMPMWSPADKKDSDQMKDKLAKNLLDKILGIPKKADVFFILTGGLSDIVSEFIDTIKFTENVNRKEIVESIVKELKSLAINLPDNEKEGNEFLTSEIYAMLEKLPIEIDNDKNITIAKLADKLTNDVEDVLRNLGSQSSLKSLNDDIRIHISDWFEEIVKLSETPPTDQESTNTIDELTRKLRELQTAGIDEINRNQMEYEIDTVSNKVNAPAKLARSLNEELMDVLTDVIYASEKANKINYELDNKFKENMDKLVAAKDKEDMKFLLSKEINFAVNTEDISEQEKQDLRYKTKQLLNENFDIPVSKNVKINLIDGFRVALKEATIGKAKEDLMQKLTNIANLLDEIQPESLKEHIFGKLLKDVNLVLRGTDLPADVKESLKQTFKSMLNSELRQPFTDLVRNSVLDDINVMVTDSTMANSQKNDLIEKLKSVVIENLNKLPDQTLIDYAKESMIHDINDLLNNTSAPKKELRHLKIDLRRVVAERLDQPWLNNMIGKLKTSMHHEILKSTLRRDEKDNLEDALADSSNKHLGQLPQVSAEEHAKDAILRNLPRMFGKINLPISEQSKLTNEMADMIDESFYNAYLSDVRDGMLQNIRKLFNESSIVFTEKEEFADTMINTVNNILDQTHYGEKEWDNLDIMYDMIDKIPMDNESKKRLKSKLKNIVDDYSDNPDFVNLVKEGLGFAESKILIEHNATDEIIVKYIKSALNEVYVPNEQEHIIENKLSEVLIKSFNQPRTALKHIDEIVEELPLSSPEKIKLKSKLKDIFAKESDELEKEIETAILDIQAAIDLSSLLKQIKDTLKSNIKENILIHLNKPISSDVKDNLKNKLIEILENDVPSKEVQNHLKNTLITIIDKIPTHLQDKTIFQKKVVELGDNIIDEAPIRDNIKHQMKSEFKNVIYDSLEEPMQEGQKQQIKDKVDNIINESPITEYYKEDLKQKLTSFVSKLLDQFLGSSEISKNKTILDDIFKILDSESLSKVKNSKLKDKFRKALIDLDKHPLVDMKNKTVQTVKNAIDDTGIPIDQKAFLKTKLENTLGTFFDELQSDIPKNKLKLPSTGNVQDTHVKDVLSNESDLLYQEFKPATSNSEIKAESLNSLIFNVETSRNDFEPYSDIVNKFCKENVLPVLYKANIPQVDKEEVRRKITQLVIKTLEKPLKSDTMQILTKKITKIIQEAIQSKDQNVELINMNYGTTKTMITLVQINDSILPRISTCLNNAPLTANEKKYIMNKIINTLVDYLNKPISVDTFDALKKIIDIVLNETITHVKKKTVLRRKIMNLINGGISYLTVEDYSENMYKPSETALNLVDAFNQTAKLYVSRTYTVNYETDKNTKMSRESSKLIKKAIIKQLLDIVNETKASKEKKDILNHGLRGIIDANVHELFLNTYKERFDTKLAIAEEIRRFLDRVDIPEQAKNKLYEQFVQVVNQEINKFSTHDVHAQSSNSDRSKKSVTLNLEDSEMGLPTDNSSPVKKQLFPPKSPKKLGKPTTSDSQKLKRRTGNATTSSMSSNNATNRQSSTKYRTIPSAADSFMTDELPTKTYVDRRSVNSSRTNRNPVTSTPTKDRKGWDMPNFSAINGDESTMNSTVVPEDKRYWEKLEKLILKWIDRLPMHLNDETREMVKAEVHNDIEYRQKYLAMNPLVRPTKEAEVECLMYRVYRMISKVLAAATELNVMHGTEGLVQSMLDVDVNALDEDDVIDEQLQSHIENLVSRIPTGEKDFFKDQTIRRNIQSKLEDKLKQLNPEELGDDYEDIVRDEIAAILDESGITPDDEVTGHIDSFIRKVGAETPHGGKEKQTFKQQLRDTLSTSLSDKLDDSVEQQEALESLIDDLADAFIDLRYAGDDKEQRDKMQKKINDKISEFCDDHLKRHPDKPIDRHKLAGDLYSALHNVSLLPDESLPPEEDLDAALNKLLLECELLKERQGYKKTPVQEKADKVGGAVFDFLKELPIEEQTAQQQLETARKIDTLSNKLANIMHNEKLTEPEKQQEMEKEVTNFIKSLPLKPGHEKNIEEFTKKIMGKIAAADETGAASTSSTAAGSDICPTFKSLMEQKCKECQTEYPPCNITEEDKAHLERIRQRTCMAPDCLNSLLRDKQHASVSPMPLDTECQTFDLSQLEPCPSALGKDSKPCPGVPPICPRAQPICPRVSPICPGVKPICPRVSPICPGVQPICPRVSPICPGVPTVCPRSSSICPNQIIPKRSTCVQSDDIQPQVIIKEYFWDSDLPDCPGRKPPCAPPPCPRSPQKRVPCIPSTKVPSKISISRTPSPCSPMPCVSGVCSPADPLSHLFIPPMHSTPRNSYIRRSKRNGLQDELSEPCTSKCPRKKRVIELGSLDDLRNPCQKKKYNWDSCSRHCSDAEELDDTCDCKRSPNPCRRRDCAVGSSCNDKMVKRCPKCCGVHYPHCPYPSHMYFK